MKSGEKKDNIYVPGPMKEMENKFLAPLHNGGKEPEVEATLNEPNTNGTDGLLKKYKTKSYKTHLCLEHMQRKAE